MVTSNTTFEFEENSRRLANRYRGQLTIQNRGKNLDVCNWSASGCLVEVDDLPPEERLTLLIPCIDGDIAIKVHFKVIRAKEGRIALRFVFDNAMDSATLAAHSRNVECNRPSDKEHLLRAGRPIATEKVLQAAESDHSFQGKLGRYMPLVATVIVIIALASIIVPHIRSQLLMKMGEKGRYISLADNRLAAAKIQHQALLQKLRNANEVIQKTPMPLTTEQKALFKLGIDQIQSNLELQAVNVKMLEANLSEVKRGNFFYEKEALGPFSTQFPVDSAPFLTQLLSEIAQESRLYPKTPDDETRFRQVAKQRYDNVLAEFQTNKTKLAMLGEFKKRYEKLVAKGALPRNTLLLVKRDQEMLAIEQERLRTTVELLKENWENTEKGNFTLETRLLDKFSPSSKSPPTTFDYNLSR